MKNSIGNNVILTIFGESHGEAVGAVIDGLPSGIKVDYGYINDLLLKRQGDKEISTKRREKDNFKIVSGVKDSFTCGTPVCIVIENTDIDSAPYDETRFIARPSHADMPLFARNGEYGDYRGGGHISGRLTAPVVAAAGIILPALSKKGIEIKTDIKTVGNASDISEIKKEILKAAERGDSCGGALTTTVSGLPAGIGEPFFDTLEGVISHAVFAMPAVKGIEFGMGFGFSSSYASKVNDPYFIKDGKIALSSNNNGGILGGLSNGADIVFTTAVKPTPTISLKQKTVDMKNMRDTEIAFGGRHDPCIVPRAAVVQTALTAFAVCDMLFARFGSEFLCSTD